MPRNDFNGDGFSDILWRSDSGVVSSWLGQTNGGFVLNDAAWGVSADWHVAGTGDFNGDGFSDILWRSDSGVVSNWLGQANGGFVLNDANAARGVSVDWHVAGIGDFNGDSRSDILWRHETGMLSNWLGTANGSFANNDAIAVAFVPNEWRITGIGDFNGDGRSDILWQANQEYLTNWLGTDSGGFLLNDGLALARLRPDVVAIGDFNGDGRDDIVIEDDWSFLSAYMGSPDGSFDFGQGYDPFADASSASIASVGDFNGDGADDILWRNGEIVGNWLGVEGDTIDFDVNFAASAATTWQVQPNPAGLGWWDY